jgi:hypothetical protein
VTSAERAERLDRWVERIRVHAEEFQRRMADLAERLEHEQLTAADYAWAVAAIRVWAAHDRAVIEEEFTEGGAAGEGRRQRQLS